MGIALLASTGCTHAKKKTVADPVSRVATELRVVPFEERSVSTSFVSADRKLEIVLLDLGDDVGLVLRADGNTLVHVDTNQDGKPTSRKDRSFGIDSGSGKVCSWFVDADPSQCGETRSQAKGIINGKDERWEVSLRIPKTELGPSTKDALVIFEIHAGGASEAPQRFPQAELFDKVFRLIYNDSGRGSGFAENWPAPLKGPPPAPKITFSAVRKAIYLGEQVCLNWEVPNAPSVTLDPGFGEFKGKDRHCFIPEKSMALTLRANGADGPIERTERIEIKDVMIEAFDASPLKVRLGDSFFLTWDVKGATSIQLERSGSSQNSGSTFDSSVTSANTRVRVNATKKEFNSPGRYKYVLKAEGPGGPKVQDVEIEITP